MAKAWKANQPFKKQEGFSGPTSEMISIYSSSDNSELFLQWIMFTSVHNLWDTCFGLFFLMKRRFHAAFCATKLIIFVLVKTPNEKFDYICPVLEEAPLPLNDQAQSLKGFSLIQCCLRIYMKHSWCVCITFHQLGLLYQQQIGLETNDLNPSFFFEWIPDFIIAVCYMWGSLRNIRRFTCNGHILFACIDLFKVSISHIWIMGTSLFVFRDLH